MKYFEINQTVYCAIYGEGKVTSIEEDEVFSIQVTFKDGYNYYTLDGKYQLEANVTLSQNPIEPIVNKPLPEFTLTFAEAMEAVVEGKKAQFESWENNEYIKLSTKFVTFFSDNKRVDYYEIYHNNITGKWRIIED